MRYYSLERLAPHSLYMTDECVSRAAATLLSELANDTEIIESPQSGSSESKTSLPVIFHVFGNASARIYHAAVLLMHSSYRSHASEHVLSSSISSPSSESHPADTNSTDTSSQSVTTQKTSLSGSRNPSSNKSLAAASESGYHFGSISKCVRGAVFDSCPARGGIRQESQEYAARFPLRSSSVQTLVRCLFVLVYLCNLVASRAARVCKRALGFATGAELLFGRRLEQTPSPKPKQPATSLGDATQALSESAKNVAFDCDIFAECGAHTDTWRFFLENDLPVAAAANSGSDHDNGAALCDCGQWPQLYLYSKADRLTPFADVRRVVLSRQRRAIERPAEAAAPAPSRLNGLRGYVAATCWENSGHLQHLSRNEVGYVKAIADFLEYVVPIAPTVSEAVITDETSASDESPTRSPRVRTTGRRAYFRQGSSSSEHEVDERLRGPPAAAAAFTLQRGDTSGDELSASPSSDETPVNSSEC